MIDQYDIATNVDDKHFPYDYRSVMHYSKITMAKHGKISMETRDPYYQDLIGTGSGLSEVDILQINDMYGCPKYTGPLPVKQTPECHDNSAYCETGARRGECSEGWMKKKCPYSCKQCTIDKYVTYPPLPSLVPTTTVKPTTEPDPTICKDINEGLCRFQKGQCRSNPNVRKTCRKSCGLCRSICKDMNGGVCRFQKSQCRSNTRVRRSCRKTCGLCR